jgi:hypothetical protein
MKKYEYPKKVSEGNFQVLVERAKEIARKSAITLATAIIMSIGLMILFLFIFVIPYVRTIRDPTTFSIIGLVIASVLSLFVSLFLIDMVNMFLRRVFNNYISYYPSPEEFVFSYSILTAKSLDEKKRVSATIRAKSLCQELSNFTKRDPLNFRRRFYSSEFKKLSCAEIQFGRMLMFSKGNGKELLSNFALALVSHDDPTAYRYLKQLIDRIEKFGKIESRKDKIERQLKSMKAIITFVTSLVTLGITLWGIFH